MVRFLLIRLTRFLDEEYSQDELKPTESFGNERVLSCPFQLKSSLMTSELQYSAL